MWNIHNWNTASVRTIVLNLDFTSEWKVECKTQSHWIHFYPIYKKKLKSTFCSWSHKRCRSRCSFMRLLLRGTWGLPIPIGSSAISSQSGDPGVSVMYSHWPTVPSHWKITETLIHFKINGELLFIISSLHLSKRGMCLNSRRLFIHSFNHSGHFFAFYFYFYIIDLQYGFRLECKKYPKH